MPNAPAVALTKVPEVTLLFWIIKILARLRAARRRRDDVDASDIDAPMVEFNGDAIIVTIFNYGRIAQIATKSFIRDLWFDVPPTWMSWPIATVRWKPLRCGSSPCREAPDDALYGLSKVIQ